MTRQEVFFEQQNGDKHVEVLKSYDQSYAREVFASMGELAQAHLWAALKPENTYEPADLPTLDDIDGEGQDFLWDELLEQAREDGTLLSFFVVNETVGRRTESLYVSPDWPSAEAFANERLRAVL